jgi:4-aminobutyrate aminotransferase-like enzyme
MAYAPRVRINPPLVITADEIDESLALMAEALEEVSA